MPSLKEPTKSAVGMTQGAQKQSPAAGSLSESGSALLPVTVLSGFLGAGKTSLLAHVLHNRKGMRVALLVNDMNELNIDANLIRDEVSLKQGEEKMVELSNGCICCTLRGDLIESVRELADSRKYDYCLIESTGISEPLPVATTFAADDPVSGAPLLGSVARLDTLVTVVDAPNFLLDWEEGDLARDRAELGASPTDDRHIVDLLTDQVECANVIVINKASSVRESQMCTLRAILTKLNPTAKQICTDFGKVELSEVLNTRLFDMEEAEQMPGWLRELTGIGHTPETEEYGISSFVYRATRPFHPHRLDRLLDQGRLNGVVRSKGLIWLASEHEHSLRWGHAGYSMSIVTGPPWLDAAAPQHAWPADTPKEYFTLPYGDRRQELVFIGIGMREGIVRRRLDAALVSDDEFKQGPGLWWTWDKKNCESADISSAGIELNVEMDLHGDGRAHAHAHDENAASDPGREGAAGANEQVASAVEANVGATPAAAHGRARRLKAAETALNEKATAVNKTAAAVKTNAAAVKTRGVTDALPRGAKRKHLHDTDVLPRAQTRASCRRS